MTPDPEQLRAFAERYTTAWCSMDPVAVAGPVVGSCVTGSSGSLTRKRGPT